MTKLLVTLWVAACIAWLAYDGVQDVKRLEEAVKQLQETHQKELDARGKLGMESGYSQGVHDTTLAAQHYIIESCTGRRHVLVVADQSFICQPKQEI